jgi:hypothetical protein
MGLRWTSTELIGSARGFNGYLPYCAVSFARYCAVSFAIAVDRSTCALQPRSHPLTVFELSPCRHSMGHLSVARSPTWSQFIESISAPRGARPAPFPDLHCAVFSSASASRGHGPSVAQRTKLCGDLLELIVWLQEPGVLQY